MVFSNDAVQLSAQPLPRVRVLTFEGTERRRQTRTLADGVIKRPNHPKLPTKVSATGSIRVECESAEDDAVFGQGEAIGNFRGICRSLSATAVNQQSV